MSKELNPSDRQAPGQETLEGLFQKAARLRAESQEIIRRLRGVQDNAASSRAAYRGTLGLLEEAVTARDLAQRESANRQRAEKDLAAELAAATLLQRLGSQLIREEQGASLYEPIVDTAMALMWADCGSLQIIDPATKALKLLAWKGFEAQAADSWETINVETGMACGAALNSGHGVVVPDVRACAWLAGSPQLEHYERRGIRALQSTLLVSRAGEVLGLISTHWRRVHVPGERELRFLDLLSRQAADLLERQRNIEALRESQQWLELIVENTQDFAIISMDMERRITTWNTGAERMLGYADEEAIGRDADIIFLPEDRAAGACEREMRTALAMGRASDERWHLRKDGSRFWGSGVMTSLHDAGGRHLGFAKIFRDHTAIREAQQAVEQSREELAKALQETESARDEAQAAGRAKDHFLAVLSHELRTPLTPVLMAVDILARSDQLEPLAREALDMIRRNVELEGDFIKDLLDVTRISRGKFAITRAPVDFHEAIRRAMVVSQPEMESKGQQLTQAFDAVEHQVEGDFGRLQQTVWNLLKNAAKFTPDGGGIHIRTRNADRRVILEVTDTGIGIEPEALARIFEPFTQANPNIASEFGGLGLGLAIAKAAVDAHGGELRAQSEGRDRGSTFVVLLPLGTKA